MHNGSTNTRSCPSFLFLLIACLGEIRIRKKLLPVIISGLTLQLQQASCKFQTGALLKFWILIIVAILWWSQWRHVIRRDLPRRGWPKEKRQPSVPLTTEWMTSGRLAAHTSVYTHIHTHTHMYMYTRTSSLSHTNTCNIQTEIRYTRSTEEKLAFFHCVII